MASLATLTFEERQHFKLGRRIIAAQLEMPQMTNPGGGCERIPMPRATAKGKKGIWVKRRVLGHAQPGKRSKGWFVAYWAQRTRFGQRRHGCCEECEEFMTGHRPTARNVCQRQVSIDQVSHSVRRNRGDWTHQLTFIWVSSWSRSRNNEESLC